jgi:ubiquitin carboxyl-terminal hydrolase 4/11/15
LFLNETLRDKNKDLIKPRSIQISKHATFSQLDAKINRIFKNLLGMENASIEHDLKIYKYDKSTREIFELILSYSNKNKSFKISAKEIKRTEFSQKTVFDLKLGNKDVLIVEALAKNMIVKPFIRAASETMSCSLCNTKVETSALLSCDSCSQSVYCSALCKANDASHVEYHKKVASLYKKKMSMEEISQFNIQNFLDGSSKGGLVGLKNFGNTCFINSAIQCLSHCDDLTKYFLSKSFLDEINKQGRGGPDGRVAKVYYELLNDLWIGSSANVPPYDMRNVFMSFVKGFQGVSHSDAKDMVLFLFDRLHDELNRIKEKPQVDISEQSKTETDEEASARWWNALKSRENSVIVDLFHGQYKTQMKCPGCKKVTITYDPFMYLPLAIPDKNISKVRFKVFPNNYEYKFFIVEVFDVTKLTKVREVKNKIREHPTYRAREFDCILLKNKVIQSLLADEDAIYDHVFTRVDFAEEEFVDLELIFCEVENSFASKNKGDYVTFFISPAELMDERYYLLFKQKNLTALTFPKAFSISKKSRVKDLYMEVYKYYRRAMSDMIKYDEENNADTSYYETFYSNVENKDWVEKDFDKSFLGSDMESTAENLKLKSSSGANTYLFDLVLSNNIPDSNSYFFRKPSCEYCNSNCSYCKITVSLDTKIYELYLMQKVVRPFFLVADFTKYKDGFYKYYEEYIDYTDVKNLYKGELTIYDCLDQFRKEEKLDKENAWYCETCEKPQEAMKKVEIYSAPKYLVVQFKRFKLKGHKSLMELVNNKKNETFVFYPSENFDLSNNIAGPNKEANYELVAISQHSGGLQGGHFTAMGKNPNGWHEFDDEAIRAADKNDVINQNAYLLFYKKVDKVENVNSLTQTASTSINDS